MIRKEVFTWEATSSFQPFFSTFLSSKKHRGWNTESAGENNYVFFLYSLPGYPGFN
ncbi:MULTISPECIES: hypothetical protein [Enterobacterales]|uniref:hypothetical protein n=1 Tax=Enterobacterales TaxID=91347 RepID=UPI002ED8145C